MQVASWQLTPWFVFLATRLQVLVQNPRRHAGKLRLPDNDAAQKLSEANEV